MLTRSLSRVCKFKFCINGNASQAAITNANKQAKNTNTSSSSDKEPGQNVKPKWMKFFEGQEPMKIDLERSIKSENTELLQNYIKSNYISFENGQLVEIIPKVARSPVFEKIKAEIRLRIIGSNFKLTPSELFDLLLGIEETYLADKLIVLFTLSEISEHFNSFSHCQQAKIISLSLKLNRISAPLALQFLDYFNNNS